MQCVLAAPPSRWHPKKQAMTVAAGVERCIKRCRLLSQRGAKETYCPVLLHRNPFFPKYFLSVGDWTWRVWNEDLRSPLLVSPYAAAYLSSGTWSPTRPGEYATAMVCVLRRRAY